LCARIARTRRDHGLVATSPSEPRQSSASVQSSEHTRRTRIQAADARGLVIDITDVSDVVGFAAFDTPKQSIGSQRVILIKRSFRDLAEVVERPQTFDPLDSKVRRAERRQLAGRHIVDGERLPGTNFELACRQAAAEIGRCVVAVHLPFKGAPEGSIMLNLRIDDEVGVICREVRIADLVQLAIDNLSNNMRQSSGHLVWTIHRLAFLSEQLENLAGIHRASLSLHGWTARGAKPIRPFAGNLDLLWRLHTTATFWT
jgi:hypothetical protein